MNRVHDTDTLFLTTEVQQRVLGLSTAPTMYAPHDFVRLIGYAQLVHDAYKESAEAKKGRKQLPDRAAAGIAESVVVGVLQKVVELGPEYDAAIQAPPDATHYPASEDYEPLPIGDAFSPNLRAHYVMAAARRVQEVRHYQELQATYYQTRSAS